MFNNAFKIILSTVLLCCVSITDAAPIYKSDAEEIKRILTAAGVSDEQNSLLIRRMAARKIPSNTAIDWSRKIHDMKKRNLPVEVAVDRLQQGLIKNIKPSYIDKALNVLLSNLAWSNQLLVNKTLGSDTDIASLDSDERELLSNATSDLEIAARQGFKRNEISVVMSRKGVDLEMAAELARTMTVWSNYGVDKKRVLLSIKRGTRIGLNADKVQDLRENIDSKVVSEHLSDPSKIAREIWHELRHEADVMDAEHAYRTRMQRNPNSIKGTGDDSGSADDLNISDVQAVDSGSGDVDSGGSDAGMDAGGDTGMDSGGGEMDGGDSGMDGGSGETDGGSSDSGDSESYGMGGGGMGGGGMDN